jgi:ribonuclease HI
MIEHIAPIEPHEELVIFTDGGSRGNPGPSAIGVVISTTEGQPLYSFGRYLGVTTNNKAEYAAVVAALKEAAKFQAQKIKFFLDSELVVKQLKGEYRVKNPDLLPLYQEIQQLAGGLAVSYQHVPRIENQLADREVNKVLDQQERTASS